MSPCAESAHDGSTGKASGSIFHCVPIVPNHKHIRQIELVDSCGHRCCCINELERVIPIQDQATTSLGC